MLNIQCNDPKIRMIKRGLAGMVALLVVILVAAPGTIWAQNLTAAQLAPSLKRVPVPQPTNLSTFVKNNAAAIKLGKALFWDMQVGSDAVQSCASCHYHAGADVRAINTMNPGGDGTFQSVPAGGTLDIAKFPFTKFENPDNQSSPMTRSWNDILGAQGVFNTTWVGQPTSGAVEQGTPVPDPVFNKNGVNLRRVTGRNAPTAINAIYNFANFFDGRANFIFNGSNPFGDADPNAGVWVNNGGLLTKVKVRIDNASLASQATGPPGNPVEMSFNGRTLQDIGKKLLNPVIVPLGKQNVHPTDSVLGPLANSTIGKKGITFKPGLHTTYAQMVRDAFNDQYWNGLGTVAGAQHGTYTQMEANFALFWGLSVQLYEATLVSNDSPYDRFQDCAPPNPGEPDTSASCDPNALSPSAQQGLNMFLSVNDPVGVGGNCINCHGTSTFSNASIMHVGAVNAGASLPEGLVERMILANGTGFGGFGAWYDSGYYDIGVRPITEDVGRGGGDPFGNPLSFIDRSLMVFNGQTTGTPAGPSYGLSYNPFDTDPPGVVVLPCGPNDPFGRVCPEDQLTAVDGSFKVPTLRNIELTGPYMHNGGEATLMQVMDFYGRGGNFMLTNLATLDSDITVLCGLNPHPDPFFCPPIDPAIAEANQRMVVDFLLSLTDERVRQEKAPFDHPELFIPNGATIKSGKATDVMLKIPAVGANGRAAAGLPPVGTFMNLDPHIAP
jgi:cytochrome c peroxidase